MATMKTRVRWRASQYLCPVSGQVLDVSRTGVVTEDVVQLWVLQATLVESGRERQERLLTACELVHRRSAHAVSFAHPVAGRVRGLGERRLDPTTLTLDRIQFELISKGGTVQFYNLKTKEKVDVPDSEIKKRRSVRTTSRGTRQERYAVVADVDVDGKPIRMFKFVNKPTFDSLHVAEVS